MRGSGDVTRAGFGYMPALDGLRAFAVAVVLCFHAGLGWAAGGFLGVSVFFTLSGFLITSLLLAEHDRTGAVSLRAFYERRVRRLVPAAYLTVGVVLALGVVWGASQRDHLTGDALAALANVANWRFAVASQSYLELFSSLPSPLAHFWSLAIEEQCYLVLPLVAAWALRRGRRRLGITLAVLAVGSLLATLATSNPTMVYNGTHTRSGELLLGALAAVVVQAFPLGNRTRSWMATVGVGLLVVLVLTTSLQTDWLYRGGFFAVAIASVAAVVGLTGDHAVSRLFSSRGAVAVGRVSYGVYLFHWPVYLLLSPERVHWGAYPLLALRLVVTAVVTVCSYRWLERPVRGAVALARRGVLFAAVSTGLVVLVVAAAVVVPAPQYDATEQLLAQGVQATLQFDEGATGAAVSSSSVAPADTPVRVLVVGSVPAVAERLRASGFDVVDRTNAQCPAVPGVAVRLPTGEVVDTRTCAPLADELPATIAESATPPQAVVLTVGPIDTGLVRRPGDAGFPDPSDARSVGERMDAAQAGLRAVLTKLTSTRLPVVLFDAVPTSSTSASGLADVAVTLGEGLTVRHRLAEVVPAVKAATAPQRRLTRVLVLGDSTSLGLAKALDLASAGTMKVLWAGANGCTLVRLAAVRSSSDRPWRASGCTPFDQKLPSIIGDFQPDAVLVSVGPTELGEQQYAGDPRAHVAGDEAFTAFHDREIADFLKVVGDRPVIFTDSLAPKPGAWASPEMAQPERVVAWNVQVQRWASAGRRTMLWPLAQALADEERVRGSIRRDGVHPDLAPLTALLQDSQLAVLQRLIRQAQGASAPRVLVIGDSGSVVFAEALRDAAAGRVKVQWEGHPGCPFVRVAKVRSAHRYPWSAKQCPDVAAELPAQIDQFHPDAVVLVVGGMELLEQKYPGEPDGAPGHVVGDAVWNDYHQAEIDRLMAALRSRQVPLIVADTPALGIGSFSSPEMAEPARAEAFNQQLALWHAAYRDLWVLPYQAALRDYEQRHGIIRRDGSHPSLEPLTELMRTNYLAALFGALAAVGKG